MLTGPEKPEQLTIDVNIARDYLDQKRRDHNYALKLFKLARIGVVELATAPQGYRFDVNGVLAAQLTELFQNEGVLELPQVSRLSDVTYPSETLYPGRYSSHLPEAWDAIIADWRSHEGKSPKIEDRWHIETHIVAKRDTFITNDRPLVTMCNRLREEHGIEIRAMSLREYLTTRPET